MPITVWVEICEHIADNQRSRERVNAAAHV